MPDLDRPGYPRETGTFATLKRTWKEFSQDNLTDWAAALTYYGVLALFPALIGPRSYEAPPATAGRRRR